MIIRLLSACSLVFASQLTWAHDPNASRHPIPVSAECEKFEGDRAAQLDLKDPATKAAFQKCMAEKKAAREAAAKVADGP